MEERVQRVIVDYFAIPSELAQELSDLMMKQTIRERVLDRMLQQGDERGYEAAEKLLIPITAKIEAIKIRITKEFVPAQYNSQKYMWNYDGWEVDANKVQVIEIQ